MHSVGCIHFMFNFLKNIRAWLTNLITFEVKIVTKKEILELHALLQISQKDLTQKFSLFHEKLSI